ncbi:alpha/beta fold hydrolase [Swaminathania salitolerans]|uniref:AB hydrolase superfamily protein YdjP n=1 Tax=Swaminathania salitolerans TaxID=182838 RepID=A0A511BX00_9PROT|nr:alpha/beta hydrolase [Swaminathania salitolerans]GBQ11571.1 peroxidase [Swaminathania salitolerans LMG 21291]GEL02538.1 AB hydrolase superfamily protein YdjP [Swaminathania salitolerans]
MPHIIASDGTKLHYREQGHGRPLVMLHGWTFSGRFFHRNVPVLSEKARVITVDLRGHGESDKPDHSYRIARLAADLRDLLEALELEDVTVLGWSIGCPIIWSYLELFGKARLRDAIFVQQTPRQYYSSSWKSGHAACYDQAGLSETIQKLTLDPEGFDRQNLSDCLATTLGEDERAMLLSEMAKSPAHARAAMMADHTTQDWRDVLPHLDLPSLMMIAEKDAVLVPEGPAWVADNMPNCTALRFSESSHMIFLDETDKFNRAVEEFIGR